MMRSFIQLCVVFVAANRVYSQEIYRGRMRGSTFGGGTSGFGALGGSAGLFSQGGTRFRSTGGSGSLFSQPGSRIGSAAGGRGLLPRAGSLIGSRDGFGLESRRTGLFSQGGSRFGPAGSSGGLTSQRGSFSFGQPSRFESRGSFSSPSIGSSFDQTGSRLGSGFQPSRGRTAGVSSVGGQDPDDIRRILGSSVLGRELRMGERGLPRHGGAGIGQEHANGMMRGWDGNPQTLGNRFENEWSDPLQGRAAPRIPSGFNGNWGSIPGTRTFG